MGAGNESFFEEGWMLLTEVIPNAAAEFVLEGLARLGEVTGWRFRPPLPKAFRTPD